MAEDLPDDLIPAGQELPDDLIRPEPEKAPPESHPILEPILKAFGQGFMKQWEPETLGLSREAVETGSKAGFFAPPDAKTYRETGWRAPFYAMNETLADTIWRTGQAITRGAQGLYAGAQEAGVAAGLHRDIVSIPDAFMGMPGALATPKPWVKSEPIKPIADPTPAVTQGMSRVEAAQTGLPHVDAVLDSPVTKGVINNAVVDRSHTVPYTAGGSVPLKDPTVFIDHRFPKEFTIPRAIDPSATVTFDPAEPFTVHENVEQHVMERLIAGGMDHQTAYKVAHFEFAEKAEGAWYASHDIDQAAAEAAYKPYMDRIQKEPADNVPPNLYKDPYPHDEPSAAAHEALGEPKPTPEEIKQAIDILNKPETIEPPKPDLVQARNLGVIGEEKPPLSDGTTEQAVNGRMPPSEPSPPSGGEPTGNGAPNDWQQRWQQFTGKLNKPGDVIGLIRDAARENDDFPTARSGQIPLSQVEGLAEAAGVDSATVNPDGIGRLLQNDAQVRKAMQIMLDATEAVKAAARDVKMDGSPENLIKLQEALLRRDVTVEQIIGLRAEWGRTGNVFQEFLRDVKDQETLSEFLKGKGRSPKDLGKIADAVDSLGRTSGPRFLNDMRKPDFWDKFMWYWVNALISGPITHAKYVIANGVFSAYEAALGLPAGVVGGVRRAVTGSREGARSGEAVAGLWGVVAGAPDALKAAAQAARTGLQTPLPGELAQNIIPKQNRAVPFQQRKPATVFGSELAATALDVPSRGAAAIHSFFNFLNYRAQIEKRSYRDARAEGLSPANQDFWERRQYLSDNPTKDMMDDAIETGYRGTYIGELGEVGKALNKLLNVRVRGIQPFRLIIPFSHIPLKILDEASKGTPLAFLDDTTVADLKGANGAAKQDYAIARLVVGHAVGMWAINQFANDHITGYGPTDPTERQQWLATGHQPYSIRVGNEWLSFNRFGSLGTMLGLYSNLAEVAPHIKPDAAELTTALGMVVHSTGRLMEDEVGMQGLAGLMEVIDEPDRKGARFISNFGGSLLPFSSALRQTASSMDPYMRKTKSVVDGLRYYIPHARQGLEPKRNWLGEPLANPSYGGDLSVPGASSIIQHRDATADPLAMEMKALDLKPAAPLNRVGGVQLPPSLYDRYQVTAGAMTRTALENFTRQPGWYDMTPFVRQQLFRNTISSARRAAGAVIQAQNPAIIQQGIDQRERRILGDFSKPKPMAEPVLP